MLAEYFLQTLSERYGHRMAGLEPAVADIFRRYSWPGNVRELENLIERVLILEDDARVLVRHLPARILRQVAGDGAVAPREPMPTPASMPSVPLGFRAATDEFQRDLIRAALARAGGRPSEAARSLGLSRHALRHQMGKLGLGE